MPIALFVNEVRDQISSDEGLLRAPRSSTPRFQPSLTSPRAPDAAEDYTALAKRFPTPPVALTNARTTPTGRACRRDPSVALVLWMSGMIDVPLTTRLARTEPLCLFGCFRRALLREGSALAVEDAMFQVDPWEKAADCERALRLTIDPVHRENLANIREFWISLANARPFLSEGDFVKQAEAIGRFHANL